MKTELSEGRLPTARWITAMAGAALFCSGGAGLVNEVVWQRALKRFLGGSESMSSMIVVVVFMLGLGAGAILMGRRARQVRRPLHAFALVEGLLVLTSIAVCLVLRSDLTESIYRAQLVAAGLDVPLPLLFALSAAAILLLPCLLMGATMPLVSEVCQRRLGFKDSRMLGLLFFINTLGSVVGALAANFYLIPRFGFTPTMALSIGLNASAGLLLLVVAWRNRDAPDQIPELPHPGQARKTADPPLDFRRAEVLMFGLGFCSLGYEMVLFRLFALEFQPLPDIFALVLAGFLLLWSVGSGMVARRISFSIEKTLSGLAWCLLLPVVGFYSWLALATKMALHQSAGVKLIVILGLVLGVFLSFVPCVLFGYLFARVTASVARSWGRDVGRVYAWNTAGSCSGVLVVTLLGYELHIVVLLAALGLCLATFRAYWLSAQPGREQDARRAVPRWAYIAACSLVLPIASYSVDLSTALTGERLRIFFGRGGVVGIDYKRNLIWDGLWHSKLSDGRDHIGTNNWQLATSPVLVHSFSPIRDACVIGLGTGITSSTLTKLDSIRVVDTYDINRGLEDVLRHYPLGTLGVLDNPKVNMIWQDARAGLALRDKKYDLMVTQPLHLKQSGSGLLNSLEFLKLVRSRLQPDGVFCLYSQGTIAQRRAVRETAASVFPYGESMYDGYLLVLSKQPLLIDRETMEKRFRVYASDPLWREIARNPETKDAAAVLARIDHPRLSWDARGLVVTDDHPVIEYPHSLATMLELRDRMARE